MSGFDRNNVCLSHAIVGCTTCRAEAEARYPQRSKLPTAEEKLVALLERGVVALEAIAGHLETIAENAGYVASHFADMAEAAERANPPHRG